MSIILVVKICHLLRFASADASLKKLQKMIPEEPEIGTNHALQHYPNGINLSLTLKKY